MNEYSYQPLIAGLEYYEFNQLPVSQSQALPITSLHFDSYEELVWLGSLHVGTDLQKKFNNLYNLF